MGVRGRRDSGRGSGCQGVRLPPPFWLVIGYHSVGCLSPHFCSKTFLSICGVKNIDSLMFSLSPPPPSSSFPYRAHFSCVASEHVAVGRVKIDTALLIRIVDVGIWFLARRELRMGGMHVGGGGRVLFVLLQIDALGIDDTRVQSLL
jgi:hypothetical protein